MNRKEYLAILEAALLGCKDGGFIAIDADLRRELLVEMESHIDESCLRHPELPEEEVVASLTPPEILAQGLLEELGTTQFCRERPADGSREPHHGPTSFASSLKSTLRGFAGGSSAASRDWKGQLSLDGAEDLRLEFASADLAISQGSSSLSAIEIEIEVEGEDDCLQDYSPELGREGKALSLLDRDGTRVRTLRLRFPRAIQRISAETSSGDVELDAGDRDCRVVTRSGDVSIESAGRLSVETASGDVEISACSSLAVATISGDVNVEDAMGALRVKTASGDIEVKDLSGDAVIITSSGEVELAIKAGSVSINTSSGSVELEAGRDFRGGKIATSSGDIGVDLSGIGSAGSANGLDLSAESVSGDLCVGEEEADDRVPRRITTSVGGGGKAFVLRSVSGDIEVSLD